MVDLNLAKLDVKLLPTEGSSRRLTETEQQGHRAHRSSTAARPYLSEPTRRPRDKLDNTSDSDVSDSEVDLTDSDFDWNEEDEENRTRASLPKKPQRGRRLYLLFLRLARPIRILVITILGAVILVTPHLIGFAYLSHYHDTFEQIRAWSVWLAVTYAFGGLTVFSVGMLPYLLLKLSATIRGKVRLLLVPSGDALLGFVATATAIASSYIPTRSPFCRVSLVDSLSGDILDVGHACCHAPCLESTRT
jgi:hypothetical protein